MTDIKFKRAGNSITSPVDNRARKEILIKYLPICWLEDYEQEIVESSETQYYIRYGADGKSDEAFDDFKRFKLYVPTNSDKNITVEVRFAVLPMIGLLKELEELADIANPEVQKRRAERAVKMDAVKAACERGVNKHWDNKFKLEIDDPLCGKKILSVSYKILWVHSNEHFTFRIYGNAEREQVSGDQVYMSLNTDEHTHAHEFGHCIGLPDEYSYNDEGKEEQVRYYKPDGTLGPVIVGTTKGRKTNDPLANMMNSNSSRVVKEHHCWNVAIEAQALLRAKTGREIKCNILLV